MIIDASDMTLYQLEKLNRIKNVPVLSHEEIIKFGYAVESNYKKLFNEYCHVDKLWDFKLISEDLEDFCISSRGNVMLKEKISEDKYVAKIGKLNYEAIKTFATTWDDLYSSKETIIEK